MKTFGFLAMAICLPLICFSQKAFYIKYEAYIQDYDSLVDYGMIAHERELRISPELTRYDKFGIEHVVYFHNKKLGDFYEIRPTYSYTKYQKNDEEYIDVSEGKGEKTIFGLKCKRFSAPYLRDSIKGWVTDELGVRDFRLFDGYPGIPLEIEYALGKSKIIIKAKLIKGLTERIKKPKLGEKSTVSVQEFSVEKAKDSFEKKMDQFQKNFFQLTLKTIDGEKIETSDWKGKTIVLNIKNEHILGGRKKNENQSRLVKMYKDSSDIIFLNLWVHSKNFFKQNIENNNWNYNNYLLIPSASGIIRKLGLKNIYERDMIIDKKGKAYVFYSNKNVLVRDLANFLEGSKQYSVREY